jgi:hypothetical protein
VLIYVRNEPGIPVKWDKIFHMNALSHLTEMDLLCRICMNMNYKKIYWTTELKKCWKSASTTELKKCINDAFYVGINCSCITTCSWDWKHEIYACQSIELFNSFFVFQLSTPYCSLQGFYTHVTWKACRDWFLRIHEFQQHVW